MPDDVEPPEDPARQSSRLHTVELEELVEAALSERGVLPPPEPDPYLGIEVDRRYRIESLIAAGGMGLVYRCRHSVLGKRLAIKIIRGDVAQMPDGSERFLLEAKAASAIGHEHIVDIADFGALPDGSPYLVMEYLDGISLATLLRDEPDLGVPRIAGIAAQIAEGLGAAHAAGIIHRDLKPDNVFVLDKKGGDFVKILDFGVARMEQSAKKLTQAGTIVGTPHYMSPEQALGLEVDHRGDIYSLGVILYELLARRVPFDGSHYVAVLNQHLHTPPPAFSSLEPPVTIPVALELIVHRCLAKSPDDRFTSMAELSRSLAPFRAGMEGIFALPSGDVPEHAGHAGVEGGGMALAPRPPTTRLPQPPPIIGANGAATSPPTADCGPAIATARPSGGSPPVSSGSATDAAATAPPAAPSATLVLPHLRSLLSARQKRLVTGFSLLVLLVVSLAAAFFGSDAPSPSAPSEPAPVAPVPGPERAANVDPVERSEPEGAAPRPPEPAPASPAPAEPEPASPPSTAPEPARVVPPRSTSSSGSRLGAPVPATKSAEKAAKHRDPRSPASAGTATRRGSTRASPPAKPRAKDDLMNPWPSPR
jgi:hypothetical protein